MIQKTARFTLDLDIVANILPVEDRSLFLELDAAFFPRVLDDSSLSLGVGVCSRLFVVCLVRRSGQVTTSEDEHFTLGFGSRDVLGGENMDAAEEDDERKQNTKIPVNSLLARPQ